MKKIISLLSVLATLLLVTSCEEAGTGATPGPSSSSAITAFTFTAADNPSELSGDVIGTITDETILLRVPYGTDYTALIASFTLAGESAAVGLTPQESGITENNFSGDVIYTVTAESGDTSDYTVVVKMTVNFDQLKAMINNDEDVTRVDTSEITNMHQLCVGNTSFNQDISGWDVSNVTTMGFMFDGVSGFNQNLSTWNVGNVENMYFMFYGASTFNGDISAWDVQKVTSMEAMFAGASAFDQDLSNWKTGAVTTMRCMFSDTLFDHDIGSWDVSKVEDFEQMFFQNEQFSQDIGGWSPDSATDMSWMFYGTEAFDQDISSWSEHVPETGTVERPIDHTAFSSGSLLREAFHPYPSWN